MSFPQFAFNNVRRNGRAYTAFFLSSAFMVMIFFSYSVFIFHPEVAGAEMGRNSATGMKVASYIVFVFAFFFVLYSISAFLKLRNLEFGILMILGARPGQINRLILLENMFIGLLSILTGMGFGMLLAKLFLLLSTHVIGIERLPFYWPFKAMWITSLSFVALFLVSSFFTLLFIRKNKVLDLLKGNQKPKTEPKVSWLLSLLGIALLTTGAVALQQKLSPGVIVIAAVTGIAGTYFFYSQLSVLGIRLLKKNRKRLWRGTHLLWVSEMSYKVKDNARMLFLVTVVTSLACMATGILLSVNQENRKVYQDTPFAIYYTVYKPKLAEPDLKTLRTKLDNAHIQYTENVLKVVGASIDQHNNGRNDYVDVISVSQYNALAPQMGVAPLEGLAENEAAMLYVQQSRSGSYTTGETINLINNSKVPLQLKQVQEGIRIAGQYSTTLLIIEDSTLKKLFPDDAEARNITTRYLYNIPAWDGPPPEADSFQATFSKELYDWSIEQNRTDNQYYGSLTARADNYIASKQGFAMLSFIGTFIALIFSLSSASFLYFKLHTELNADMKMYHALSKIGLSRQEMSASATRQIAVLFYIPIVVATLQTLIVVRSLVVVINITDVTVPVLITAASFLAVQTVYFLVVRSRYVHSLNRMMV
ncbi:FtsX-like permease family protein [Paenibacillus donghaensis]|uniref:ABC3 transporter permease C-terminal domain-containing protein n=1 Tax=Paenibacillus donghaensis TaxID=414771 RepID=A0A2Z2KF81_9BACL|nr:ABC transporter permease [Paenibacillus donghaensis]ASA19402.1 hypothetical protein B9T62_00145 [Paenibacillus donghaensis]